MAGARRHRPRAAPLVSYAEPVEAKGCICCPADPTSCCTCCECCYVRECHEGTAIVGTVLFVLAIVLMAAGAATKTMPLTIISAYCFPLAAVVIVGGCVCLTCCFPDYRLSDRQRYEEEKRRLRAPRVVLALQPVFADVDFDIMEAQPSGDSTSSSRSQRSKSAYMRHLAFAELELTPSSTPSSPFERRKGNAARLIPRDAVDIDALVADIADAADEAACREVVLAYFENNSTMVPSPTDLQRLFTTFTDRTVQTELAHALADVLGHELDVAPIAAALGAVEDDVARPEVAACLARHLSQDGKLDLLACIPVAAHRDAIRIALLS